MTSFTGDLRHTAASDPLQNLANVQERMESLQRFLSTAVNGGVVIGVDQMQTVSNEISAAIQHTIVNAAALISSTRSTPDPKPAPAAAERGGDWEIIELDAEELVAEQIHVCEICGKGFKRDANLRMHMRAHGNKFKTPEALAKPEKWVESGSNSNPTRTRFSCPFSGCVRNRAHTKFRPLKSAICVKNHFKRTHCPKMYSCNRCNKKSFSVLADLKSHAKYCGESKWKCSCGTSFSRKDKLFGHMALFEGHMPAVEAAEEKIAAAEEEEDDDEEPEDAGKMDTKSGSGSGSENGFLDRILNDCDSIDSYCFQDLLDWPSPNNGVDTFLNF